MINKNCQICNGTGSFKTIVHWSDGDGVAKARCPECNPEKTGPITQAEYDAARDPKLQE